jgi:predicted translin family RNA/ssDNA-binding protein
MNDIIKSYDNEFRRIEREHEETLKTLRDIEYKPKKTIVKFSTLHKGMYKGY